MITHVVLFRLKERTPERIEAARAKLESMRGRIPPLKGLEIGVDALKSERSFDVSLITRHDSWEDLDAYQEHPVHEEVVVLFKQIVDRSVSVDYEN